MNSSNLLWKRVIEVTEAAKKSGHLSTIETQSSTYEDGGVKWILKFASSLANKPSNNSSDNKKKPDFDPFLPVDSNLFVCEHRDYNIVLNKFNVNPHHVLLTTKEWQSQDDDLNMKDFASSWYIIKNMNTLAFYNHGKESGASQHHKHVQFLPVPIDAQHSKYNFPLEEILLSNSKDEDNDQIFHLDELPFKHACVQFSSARIKPLSDSDEDQDCFGRYVEPLYKKIMEHLQLASNSDYNIIWTTRHLVIIPRKCEKTTPAGISMNSVAFIGTMLAKKNEELDAIKQIGPMKLLQSVAFPK